MNRRRRGLGLLGSLLPALLLVAACAGPEPSPPGVPSAFHAELTLAELLDHDELGVDRAAPMVFDSERSRTVVAGLASHHARHTAELSLAAGGEAQLLSGLLAVLRQRIGEHGLAIDRVIEAPGHLVIAYADRRNQGWLDVSGVRRSGASFRLIVVLVEHELPVEAAPRPVR